MKNIILSVGFCVLTHISFAQSNQNAQTTPKKTENSSENAPKNTARVRLKQANVVKANGQSQIKVDENGAGSKKEQQNKTEQPK